uniref:Uncharacterized protein n=1 Tax=Anguilla anguilla TaxID=7936 RepID=A0A0E9R4W4_ANGAN
MNPQFSPMCQKCQISVGTYTHCIWSSPKNPSILDGYLQDMVKNLWCGFAYEPSLFRVKMQ